MRHRISAVDRRYTSNVKVVGTRQQDGSALADQGRLARMAAALRGTRAPEPEDLARICRALNEAGARYVLIGGFAVLAHGAGRFTKAIDLPR